MFAVTMFFASASPVDLDFTVILQVGIFFILLFLLTFLLYGPILSTLEARVSKTDGMKKEAGELGLKAEKLLGEYKEQMSKHRREAEKFTSEMRQKVRDDENEILKKAKKDSADIMQEARAHIKDLEESLRKELGHQVQDMASSLASKIL
ncbi:MAG: ATP synthase F0 subunit B [Pseudomonadota bacterium]